MPNTGNKVLKSSKFFKKGGKSLAFRIIAILSTGRHRM